MTRWKNEADHKWLKVGTRAWNLQRSIEFDATCYANKSVPSLVYFLPPLHTCKLKCRIQDWLCSSRRRPAPWCGSSLVWSSPTGGRGRLIWWGWGWRWTLAQPRQRLPERGGGGGKEAQILLIRLRITVLVFAPGRKCSYFVIFSTLSSGMIVNLTTFTASLLSFGRKNPWFFASFVFHAWVFFQKFYFCSETCQAMKEKG